jgi:hypothetical protein
MIQKKKKKKKNKKKKTKPNPIFHSQSQKKFSFNQSFIKLSNISNKNFNLFNLFI